MRRLVLAGLPGVQNPVRLLWEQDVGGSNPRAPTSKNSLSDDSQQNQFVNFQNLLCERLSFCPALLIIPGPCPPHHH